MAFSLRPTDEEHAIIAEAARREGVSMQVFVLRAALDAAHGRARRRDELIDRIRTDRREVLDRLGSV
jgi:uncharacterized protein (DUF1778 family)